MHKTIIMNAKGGCGKTTIATNLAGIYASCGYNTTLFDYDPQCSSTSWLKRRPDTLPSIHGISPYQKGKSVTRSWLMRIPPEAERIVLDTPAGVKPHDANECLKGVNTIIVPVLASVIDVEASAIFIQALMRLPKVRSNQTQVMVVANRVKTRSPALQFMKDVFSDMGIPIVTQLKDTVSYVQGTDLGISIHELPSNRAKTEKRSWQMLVEAIDADFDKNALRDDTLNMPFIQSLTDSHLSDISLSIPLDHAGPYNISWK